MESQQLNIEKEFHNIFLKFEQQLDERCTDLHCIGLSVLNFPEEGVIKFPNPYITYFLKGTGSEPQNHFATYTKHNREAIITRANNFFVQNILNLAEWHLKEGLCLLNTILAQDSMTISTESFKEKFKTELERKRTFGALDHEIRKTVKGIGVDIIPNDSPHYGYLSNYIMLRNCLAHKGGVITDIEVKMEIRLPFIDETQIANAVKEKSNTPINPQTIIRKWSLNERISLRLSEVEGIAYGLLKTLFQIFKHMYKAADAHAAKLEKSNPTTS